ncbi:MAG: GNAT family N-acetyltransferase [Chloroflexota bacterium]
MASPQLRFLAGLEALDAVTALLRRNRLTHPTAGLWEAADLQWWHARPRSTDMHPQPFWFEADGRPVAAMIATDWGEVLGLDPILLPDAPADLVAEVVAAGVAGVPAQPAPITMEIDRADLVLQAELRRHGFAEDGDGLVEAWRRAADRPPVSPLTAGYRLVSRQEAAGRPHPMARRGGPGLEARLRETSLYRADLDLAILDDRDEVATYALFWFDPVTATGLVEPMRTEDAHQRRGLARHVLTAGVERLAAAGATRIKICFEPDNPGASRLYLDVGFTPVRQTARFARPAPP